MASIFHSSMSAELDAARAKFVGRMILRILSEAASVQNCVQAGVHVSIQSTVLTCVNPTSKGGFKVLMLPYRCCCLAYFRCVRHNDALLSPDG